MKYMPRMIFRGKSEGRYVQQLCISVSSIQDIPLSIGVRWCVMPCRSRVTTKELQLICTDPERRSHLSRAVPSLIQKMSPRCSMEVFVLVYTHRLEMNRRGVMLGQ